MYTISGTDNHGCIGTKTIAVVTITLPVIGVSPASPTVCSRTPIILTALGGVTYQWSDGSITSSINLTPSVTATYSITGTDASGCSNTKTFIVTVNPLPNIAAASVTSCVNQVTTFTASGGSSYTWTPGNVVGTLTVSPNIGGVYLYTVTGTDNNGCINEASVVLNVGDCTGIKTNNFSGNTVRVYPNPSTGIFITQFEFEGKKTVMIFSSVGQLMEQRSSTSNAEVFDVSSLAKGVYFVKVLTKEASGNYKLIIE